MVIENNKALDEAQIRTLLEDRVKAVRVRNVNGAMSNIVPNIVTFDVIGPLQHIGSDASRKRVAEWFASFQGAIGHEIWDLSITVGEDVAFSHSLNRVFARTAGGTSIDMFWRATICYCKFESKWMVTHEHNSVPFDPASGRASLGLKP